MSVPVFPDADGDGDRLFGWCAFLCGNNGDLQQRKEDAEKKGADPFCMRFHLKFLVFYRMRSNSMSLKSSNPIITILILVFQRKLCKSCNFVNPYKVERVF